MIAKVLSFLISPVIREFFSALFNFLANKKALDEAKRTGWTEAHAKELENIVNDNIEARELENRMRDAQTPPTIDQLNGWLLDNRPKPEARRRNKD